MIAELVCTALGLFTIALFARIILSWFPIAPGGALASIYGVLYNVTEPVLGPVRRLLPSMPALPLDLSPILIFIAIRIVQSSIGCGGFI